MSRSALVARGDRGMGLPELIVTMLLIGIFASIVLALVTTMYRSFSRDRAATDSANIAAIGMNEMTRVIRSGTEVPQAGGTPLPVVVEADEEHLVLHTYLDTDSTDPEPLRVRFTIDSDRDLIEDRWLATVTGPQTWSFPSTTTVPATSRVIARKISPSAAEPVFQYYHEDSLTPIPVPVGGFTADDLANIVRIEVTLSVQADLTDRAQPVVLTNTVGIPNLGINVMGAATP